MNPTASNEEIKRYIGEREALESYGIRGWSRKCKAGVFVGAYKASRGEGWRAPVESVLAWIKARTPSPEETSGKLSAGARSLAEWRRQRGRGRAA